MIVNNQRVKKLEKEHLSEEKLKEGNKQFGELNICLFSLAVTLK